MTSIIDPIERGGSGGLSAWVGHLVDTVAGWPRAYRNAYRRAPRRTLELSTADASVMKDSGPPTAAPQSAI